MKCLDCAGFMPLGSANGKVNKEATLFGSVFFATYFCCSIGIVFHTTKRLGIELFNLSAVLASFALLVSPVQLFAGDIDLDVNSSENTMVSDLHIQVTNAGNASRATFNMSSFKGCYGETDYIHVSYGSMISVHARTVCPGYSKLTSTNLTRERWYGWQHLANGSSTGNNDAVTKWYCKGTGKYTYRATNYHCALVGKDVATAYTWVTQEKTC